jgi:uncharacterized protein YgbK (DUF1537 family)
VPVLLAHDRGALQDLLRENRAVFILTNTRALPESEAVALLTSIRRDVDEIAAQAGWRTLVVQRGDSTLRGHVFAEVDAFSTSDSVTLFAPAFPAGGRRTRGGVHEVSLDGHWLNAADTEYAQDPVFGYAERTMADYVAAHGHRPARSVPAAAVAQQLLAAAPGTVVVPDAETDEELASIAEQVIEVSRRRPVIVRCAATLAAYLSEARSQGYLPATGPAGPGPLLVVAGSHTAATTRQLACLRSSWPSLVELDADQAIVDPAAAAAAAVRELEQLLRTERVVTIATSRLRRSEHGSLHDGARVMDALTRAVAAVAERPSAVVAKGGITSAEVARVGLSAKVGWVLGQVRPGISLWRLDAAERRLPYVVVPGNMGDDQTLASIVEWTLGSG